MSLHSKLFFLILTPIILFTSLHLLSFQAVTARFSAIVQAHQDKTLKSVALNIQKKMDELNRASLNLSHPQEITAAVLANNRDVLMDCGESFAASADNIIFADSQGDVLTRIPDRFSIGNMVGGTAWFSEAMRSGHFYGLDDVDGSDCMVSARTVRKDDVPVGVVCIAVAVNQRLLSSFVDGSPLALRFSGEQDTVESISGKTSLGQDIPLNVPMKAFENSRAFSVRLFPDGNWQNTLVLERTLFVGEAVVALMILLGVYYVLNRHFRPYSTIAHTILQYSQYTLSLTDMRSKLSLIKNKNVSDEIVRIVDTIVRIIDTLKFNFERIDEYSNELKSIVKIDKLTSLHNRKFLDDSLESEVKRCSRYGSPLSIMVIEVDHFHDVLERYESQKSDQILTAIALILRNNSRELDSIGRWTEKDFLIISSGTGMSNALIFAEKLRTSVEAFSLAKETGVTVSIGVAQYHPGESVQALIARGETALEKAKREGGNAVRSLTAESAVKRRV